MSTIDSAKWHCQAEFPENYPPENGGTHIGMYFAWIIHNNLVGEAFLEETKQGVELVKNRTITGRDFLFEYSDEKFFDDCLNSEGIEFTRFYYKDSKGKYRKYLTDYERVLARNLDSAFEVSDTWENYDLLARKIDERYQKWKFKTPKKSWQFWKK